MFKSKYRELVVYVYGHKRFVVQVKRWFDFHWKTIDRQGKIDKGDGFNVGNTHSGVNDTIGAYEILSRYNRNVAFYPTIQRVEISR